MTVNLEHCKAFYYVANCKSVTEAARKLFVSQPAVSQSVKQLEQQLGCALFFRTSRGVRLTAEGELFYSKVKLAFDEIEQGERKLSEMLGLESGEIRIGASDMTMQFFLLPYLEEFHKLYPKIRISVSGGTTPETLSALREGSIDFGLITTPVDGAGDLVLTEVCGISDIFVASEKFSELRGRVISLGELSALPVICLEKNTSARKSIDRFLKSNGTALSPEFELGTSELIVKFAERGLGVGLVMSGFAKEAVDSGRLFCIKTEMPIPARKICVAVSAGRPVSVTSGRLLELINKDRKI